MDVRLDEMLYTVWDWSLNGTEPVGWQLIYQQLYAQDVEGLGADVELLSEPTQAGLIMKIESKRKERGDGGEQRGYYFFCHPDFAGEAKYRVVLRTADQRTALALMELIVPTMVDAGGNFAGVHSAKVITAEAYEAGRKDLIVVYANDVETQDAVVAKIRQYRSMGRFGDTCFRDPLPVGIKWLGRGFGTASQPPAIPIIQGTGGVSYGKFLAQVVDIALRTAVVIHKTPLKLEDFRKTAKAVLRMAGVNPKFPDVIGPMSIDFTKFGTLKTEDDELKKEWIESVKEALA
jgi:hypothetical protein